MQERIPNLYHADHLLKVRKAILNDRLEHVLATVDKCLETRETMCVSDNATARADDCDAMVLGSFLRELQKLGVLPRSQNQKIYESMSVSEFDRKLTSMDIKAVHLQCRMGPLERYNVPQASIPEPVPEAHHRHMKAQREILELE